jgi:hypothetical protein
MKKKQGTCIKNETRRVRALRASFMRLSMALNLTVDSTTVLSHPYPPFLRATILLSSVLLPAPCTAVEVMN